jgi:hypothetical protein
VFGVWDLRRVNTDASIPRIGPAAFILISGVVVNEGLVPGTPLAPRWWTGWLNLTWILYGWWAREHQLNMQALGLHWPNGPGGAQQQRALLRWEDEGGRGIQRSGAMLTERTDSTPRRGGR